MGPLPPFQVTVDTKGWLCVLDVRLALARHGPMLALRLAEELRVCLVPRLWSILDNTTHYRLHPQDLLADPFADARTPMPDPASLDQWERARLDLSLPVLRLYWAGERIDESFMPKEVDSQVIQRFERFGLDLEQRLLGTAPDLEPALPLLGGALDATALAAAMSRYRPLILTLAEPSDEAPALCRLLAACGVDCRKVDSEQSRPLRRQLTPLLARSGALELCWTGLDLAVVHLVAPRAFLSEALDTPDPDLESDLESSCGEGDRLDDVWQDASAFWYRLP
ncbi:hypothetical protein [Thiocapsa bogorovii]|uniref:hypothetical protein n=1 Tax=Thiocapsa bogorovii TaxID=521689 RepID=UPI001E2A03A1|nr:hypothetical protein [Thiocapsa bogorovii]UHD15645.1 hypothetical protein LT988_20680 [Thiocapsa bogorovii]